MCIDMLERHNKKILALLRVALGWLFFYAGFTKLINPAWSAKGYLLGAKTFSGFYTWLTSDSVMPIVDFVNEWGLTLLGASLILGIAVRFSSMLGALMMLLYWFPVLTFPYVDHGYLVDDHIVYALVLLYFAAIGAGRYYGLGERCSRLPLCARYPKLRAWLN
jgi:thiosulfate dehydrogenase [quinone] large subunit